MNKLQRYWAEESSIYGLTTDDCDMGETCRLVCKDADVSAIESENERLREDRRRFMELADRWYNMSWGAFENPGKDLRRILNREQEKQ